MDKQALEQALQALETDPQSNPRVNEIVSRIAFACFIADIGVRQWTNMDSDKALEFARAHGIGIEDLILATKAIGVLCVREARAIQRYKQSCGHA